jgi:hypothetical protein
MGGIERGRWSAEVPEGTVMFLIGMRVNRLGRPWSWGPVALAMAGMQRELATTADLGLLAVHNFVSGRTTLSLQYWRTWDDLQAYSRGDRHLPAWRAFNRRARGNPDVGVYHETSVLRAGQHEEVYVDMPRFGLGLATPLVPVGRRGDTSTERMVGPPPPLR